ncbi:MAG TPA: hypothetical protein VM367_05150 [Pseudonocardia sp.]|jgi:hypothetical protein|nr:hypothetical protein [Pseudonocardia sp.]
MAVPALVELLSAMLGLGLLIALLRWTFGTGRGELAPPGHDPADSTGDGLLTEVTRLPTEAAALVLCRRLGEAGIRATVGRTGDGYRLLVFHGDLVAARVVLSRGALG